MATLLLREQSDTRYFRPHRTGARERLRARVCAWRLDDALARGAAPDSTPELLLHAQRLIGPAARSELAHSIRTLIDDAGRPCHPLASGVSISRAVVVRAGVTLIELADRLAGDRPVDARGVALVRRLLRDGASPVFNAARADELERELMEVLEALEPRAP